MKTDAEKLMDMILARIPLMTQEELKRLADALEQSRIDNLMEIKENQLRPKEDTFPKLYRYRPLMTGFEKCTFGRWPQWDRGHNEMQPLRWHILRKQENRLLLLGNEILEWLPFQTDEKKGRGWKDSSLRKWLNQSFYLRAFNMQERRRICFFDPDILSEDNLMDRVGIPSWTDLSPMPRMGASLTVRCQQKMKQSGWQDREYWIRKDTENDSEHVMAFVLHNEGVSRHRCSSPAGVRPAIWILDDEASSDISI